MNRQLNRLAVASIVLLVALVVATTYWQTWASAGLQDKQDNAIQRVVQFSIARGLIQTAGKKVTLATNTKKTISGGETIYRRKYPQHGFAAQTVGYSTESRAQAGLERSMNDYLTGANTNLSDAFRHILDRLGNATVHGNNLELTIRPRRAAACAAAPREPLRCSRCDESAHGSDLRDGVVTDVRPQPHRQAGRVREGAEDPRRVRRRVGAVQPRDAGPLRSGLDVQDDHRRRGARHRRVQSGLDLLRPGLLHGVRQAGLECG